MNKDLAIFGKPVKHPVWEQTKELVTMIIFECVAFLYLSDYLYERTLAVHMEWAFTVTMVITIPLFIAGLILLLLMLADVCIYRSYSHKKGRGL